MSFNQENFAESVAFVQSKLGDVVPEVAIILGSGLGFFADSIEDKIEISYADIPHFPRSTVMGHKGQFVIGKIHGKTVICMQGRVHLYEGHSMASVVLPVRLMAKIGVKKLIVTNAAGGINSTYVPGTLMLLTDHINFFGTNPLIGPNIDEFGVRFPDMSKVYSDRLINIAFELKDKIEADLQKGVYVGLTGPSFETPAEIRAFRTLGADAVGMSTVPEAIVARHAGLEVVGISCITNMAAGMMANHILTHEEVAETADRVSSSFIQVVDHLVKHI